MAVFTFVVHTTCYCMDAIHLSGNIWINCFYAQGKSGKTARVSVRSKGRGSFGTVVYIYVSYIYTKVFNCGISFDTVVVTYLYVCMARIYFRVALIWKYMYGYIYMEVFSCNLEPRFIFWHI